ncbi:5-carboxymethyl-2-hydroxymuconate Delta-isomerase [Streptomyces sp. TLI_171]|uniref:5-carboxymethyl-2-hydroxymuconate Delta-isomerase n=1 Tax=Streptomyces sp. TLI_171 TaxID=1938859 RepID=UPI000C17D064|nr:isomerase [Streptomyces sp. TLI_171]RKE18061.1 5-carboxymethyl-2-hydroxymuconate isomerase [Streptomyces sp. TLI_171]
MPLITVDYTDRLADSFDRRGFGLALNRLAVKLLDARPTACKTRFRRTEEAVVGADAETFALVAIEFAIFPGRTAEAKAALSEAVLAALPEYLGTVVGPVQATVAVGELDSAAYRSATLGG